MSTWPIRRIGIVVVAVVAILLVAAPALAQTRDGADGELIVLSGGLVVETGETVSDAVSFNGDATIDGTVTESLVVFNGDVSITGSVRRDVVVFNGSVVVAGGATVGGDVMSRQTARIEDGAQIGGDVRGITNRIDWDDVGILGRFTWWLAYSISTLILGLLLLLLAPALDGAVRDAASRFMGRSIGFGAMAFFLTPIVAVILMVTIVGIPLGLFLLLALALLYTVGYVAGGLAIGRMLLRPPSSRFVAFLAGWGIVRVLGLVPFLGGAVWVLVTLFGLGVLLVASRRGTEERVVTVPPSPSAIPARADRTDAP